MKEPARRASGPGSWLPLSLAVLASCAGEIPQAAGEQVSPPSVPRGSSVSAAPPRGAGGDPVPGPAAQPAAAVPGSAPETATVLDAIRRLSAVEYRRTTSHLLGTPLDLLDGVGLPDDSGATLFSNASDLQTVTVLHVERYAEAADRLATAVFASPTQRQALMGCPAPETEACLRAFIERFGQLAFRRPVEPAETRALLDLGARASTADPTTRSRAVLEAILQSPSFVFRPEVGLPVAGRTGLRKLTGLEMATRLAYFLWSSGPDASLLTGAMQGGLDSAQGVAAAARRLLADSRSAQSARIFFDEWFGLAGLPSLERSRADYPAWSSAAGASMREELLRVIDDHRGTGADFVDLFTVPYTHLDANLARIYGAPAPAAKTWVKHDFPAGGVRGGLLTLTGLLTSSAHGATPIARAAYIRETLLCQDLPEPPADVPPLPDEPSSPGLTGRARFEQHRSNPACSGCHAILDPLGFGLERFDAIGAHRTRDRQGRLIAEDGLFVGAPAPAFNGGVELGRLVAGLPDVADCLVKQLHRFALGRLDGPADAAALDAIRAALPAGKAPLQEIVVHLVASDLFRFRSVMP